MKNILIIDDDPISIVILKKNLELALVQQKTTTFKDGAEALAFIKNENTEEAKYVIFLDINMPNMNGWEFLEKTTRLLTERNSTIYVLSSSLSKYDKEKATEFPIIKQYLAKPISKEVLSTIKAENQL